MFPWQVSYMYLDCKCLVVLHINDMSKGCVVSLVKGMNFDRYIRSSVCKREAIYCNCEKDAALGVFFFG